MQLKPRRYLAAALCATLAVTTASCGNHKKRPAGPDVRGLVLPDAETALKKAKVGFTEHAKDATFGIIVKDNYIVCSEAYVSKHMVRLEVAKHGC